MPDLWPAIELRAAARGSSGTAARVVGRRTTVRGAPLTTPLGRRSGISLSWAAALGLLLVTAIAAGGLVAGAWRIEDIRLPVIPPDATPAESPTAATSPTTAPRPTPTFIGCAPVAPETYLPDYTVAIEDPTGVVTACRLGRGLFQGRTLTEGDIEISNPRSLDGRLRLLWSIRGCDSHATVRFAGRPQTSAFTYLTVDARQVGECIPGRTFVTVDIEFVEPVFAEDVVAGMMRTPSEPGESPPTMSVPTDSAGPTM